MIDIQEGFTAWTRRLYWSVEQGTAIRDRCGETKAWRGSARQARIVRSRLLHRCLCCGSLIPGDELHGADEYPRFTDHYCLGCLTAERPADQYRTLEDPPSEEDRSDNPQRRWAA